MIARSCENFRKHGKNNYTAARIHSRISAMKETWRQCIRGHAVICSKVPEKDRATCSYFQQNQLEVYEEHYHTTLDLMQEWLEEIEPTVSHHSVSSDSLPGSSNAPSALSLRHLPPIKLPPFSGDFREWEGFRDRFTALIIANKELPDFSCMHFLTTSLSGAAYGVWVAICIIVVSFNI